MADKSDRPHEIICKTRIVDFLKPVRLKKRMGNTLQIKYFTKRPRELLRMKRIESRPNAAELFNT